MAAAERLTEAGASRKAQWTGSGCLEALEECPPSKLHVLVHLYNPTGIATLSRTNLKIAEDKHGVYSRDAFVVLHVALQRCE